MTTYTSAQTKANLFQLIKHVGRSHEPIYITNKGAKIMLMSEEDYSSVMETIYINSIPGLAESILKARKESRKDRVEWTDDL